MEKLNSSWEENNPLPYIYYKWKQKTISVKAHVKEIQLFWEKIVQKIAHPRGLFEEGTFVFFPIQEWMNFKTT